MLTALALTGLDPANTRNRERFAPEATPPTPLLLTKLAVPPARPALVSRPALQARLNAALTNEHGLISVSATAGSGKTTLLSEWVADHNFPTAWLSLDEADDDPTRFTQYLLAAFALASPALAPLATSPHTLDSAIAAIANALVPHTQPLLLLLDDYHLLTHPAIHAALDTLLDHQPPALHLVLLTRADPPLNLARRRARHQLTELRGPDLRFTTDETGDFLNRLMQLDLSPTQVAALSARTEGWAAGLQLAALSLREHGDAESFIAHFSGSDRHVFDYLVDEVLRRQPDDVQHFLLHTSALDRLCGSLCDVVLDDGRRTTDDPHVVRRPSSVVLEELEHHNLFVFPLDRQRQWYRYQYVSNLVSLLVTLIRLQSTVFGHISNQLL